MGEIAEFEKIGTRHQIEKAARVRKTSLNGG